VEGGKPPPQLDEFKLDFGTNSSQGLRIKLTLVGQIEFRQFNLTAALSPIHMPSDFGMRKLNSSFCTIVL